MAVQPLPSKQYSLPTAAPPRTPKRRAGAFDDILKQVRKADEQAPMGGETYTVRSGDSLYRIAKQFKETHPASPSPHRLVSELTDMNGLQNPNLIFPGQVLRVPLAAGSKNHAPVTAPTTMANPSSTAVTFPAVPGVTSQGLPFFSPSRQEWPALSTLKSKNIAGDAPPAPIERKEQPKAAYPPAPAGGTLDFAAQVALYKEDQLLAHPGGDYYFLNRDTNVFNPAYDQSLFVNRVGKDLADVGENLLNMAKDLAMGSSFKYMGRDGKIKDGQRTGLLGTVKNFFEDLLSGLSFGAYVPAGEKAPQGVAASVWHFLKKVFYEAPVKDLLVGVPHAAINIFKGATFAAINLLEIIPDATIGNFEWGQKLTTSIFDNGQVAIDYLTDILPGGNAWLRVHAAGASGEIGPPIFYNLRTTEHGVEDSRWTTVRDTSFRKTIETIGSLLSDTVAFMAITSQVRTTSTDQRKP